jgi:hypothetical protein
MLDGDLRFVGPQSITTTTGDLMLAPVGDVTLNPTGAQIRVMASHTLQSDNYASQTTGWGISYVGGADFRYLFADELHVKSFISDLEMALAGGQIISKSVAMLSRAFTAPAAGATATLYVWDLPSAENMAAFQSGDIVRLRTFSRSGGSLTVADCWGVVTSYSNLSGKEQSWTFTRSTSSNAGSMTAGTVVAADSLALDYGTTGNGFYEVNAVDGAYGANSPYSQIVTWATHPATGQTTRVRLGNLYGITAITEYGLFAGEGVSAGDSYLRLTDQNFELHNLDLALYDSGNVQRIGMDAGAGSADKLMWAGTSAVAPQFVVYGDGDVALLNCDLSITDGDFTLQTAASGARFELTSTGIKAYNSSNVQRVKIANDGSGWFGSSSAFTWTTAGAVTATGITVQSAASGGRVVLDASGIAGYSASYKTFALATDGDVFAGSNLGAAATTAFAVFANAQTYNGEAVGAGDVLLGDNSAGKINLLWDMGEGDVLLRRGTSTRIKLDGSTDIITVGDDSSKHLTVSPTDVRLWDGANALVQLTGSYLVLGTPGASNITMDLSAADGVRIWRGGITLLGHWKADGSIAIGASVSGANNVQITSAGAISIRNYNTDRISMTAAGVLTINDSGGNAVITLDASAGAEITRKLTMPGANSAITIGATPPTSSSAGTGIWIDRTGLYGLSSGTYQVKLQAADGKLFAGAGTVRLDSTGIKLVRGSSVYNKIEWRSSDFSTTYASIYNFLTGTTSELVLYSDAPSGNFGGVRLIAEDGSAVRAEAYLSAYGMTIDGGGLSVSGGLYVGNAGDTAENGVIGIAEISSTPSIISAGNEVHVYLKGDKLIFQFNDRGTVRYKYLNLTGTGITWVHTTTAP